MTSRWRRWVVIGLLAVLCLVGALLPVLHLPPVQRWAWARVTSSIADTTGWQIATEAMTVRLWPARARVRGLQVTAPKRDAPLARVSELDASWSWPQLFSSPRRLQLLSVTGATVDLEQLPSSTESTPPAQATEPLDPWAVLEVGELTVTDLDAIASAAGVQLRANDARIEATVDDGLARLLTDVASMTVTRAGRTLDIGSLVLEATADRHQVRIERLLVDGEGLTLAADGTADADPGGVHAADATAQLTVAPQTLLAWWDPALTSMVELSGQLSLDVAARQTPEGDTAATVRTTSSSLRAASYRIDAITAEHGTTNEITVSGGNWGRLQVDAGPDLDQLALTLQLTDTDPVPAARLATVQLPEVDSVRIDGELTAMVPLPFSATTVRGEGWFAVRTDELSARLEASGTTHEITVHRALVQTPDASLAGAGSWSHDGTIAAELEARVEDLQRTATVLRRWAPVPPELPAAGGPIQLTATIGGRMDEPEVIATATWFDPQLFDIQLQQIEANASGTLEALDWSTTVQLDASNRASANGTASVTAMAADGSWELTSEDLAEAVATVGVELPEPLSGAVNATGTAAYTEGQWQVTTEAAASELAFGPWQLDQLNAQLEASPSGVLLHQLEIHRGRARLVARATAPLGGLDEPLWLEASLDDLQLEELPVELPAAALGEVSATLEIEGTASRPEALATLSWQPTSTASAVSDFRLRAALTDGQLTATSERLETVAGPAVLTTHIPIGSLPRPSWFWSDAPHGAAALRLDAHDVRLAPVLQVLGVEPATPVDATGDLQLDVRWDLQDPSRQDVELTVGRLSIAAAGETLTARERIRVHLSGGQLIVEPFELVGEHTSISALAEVDLATKNLSADGTVRLAPDFLELTPVPMVATAPLVMSASVDGPFDALDGTLTVDHPQGSLVMRDPPVQISNLRLQLGFNDGAVTIEDGHAEVNGGSVEAAGGWNPTTGEGILIQPEEVAFVLSNGILTRWNGLIALEPADDGVTLAGTLVLASGLWDRSFDITSAVGGVPEPPPPADDPLHAIALDLDIRARGPIHVDNNLGEFDVGWDLLSVTGTAAEPVIEGTVRLAAGGTLALSGRPVPIRRGVIEFPGEPGADPTVEVVTEDPISGASSGGASLADLAQQNLLRGIGKALGLDNRSITPAEIATETEADAGRSFSIAQTIGEHLVAFVTTDLTDPQRRTTMLQAWNFRGFPGLALQGFSSTGDEDEGYAVIERLELGGGSTDDRPRIQRIRLRGSWPVSKRRMRSAVGLDRGQLFDPFLLFVGEVRLERALAEHGYFTAKVTGRKTGVRQYPRLEFEVEPGPRRQVVFRGEVLRRSLRQEITGLYQPPPLEEAALANMEQTLRRVLNAQGYPQATVRAWREHETILVHSRRGPKRTLVGPVLEGVEPAAETFVRRLAGSPAALAALARGEPAARQRIERLLSLVGYRQARVLSVAAPDGLDDDRVVVQVDPGPVATVAELRVAGTDPLNAVAGTLPIAVGNPLVQTKIDATVRTVRSAYREAGYPDAAVRANTVEVGPQLWALELEVEPGSQRTIGHIELPPVRLRKPLLEKALGLEEGTPVRVSDLDAAAARLATIPPVQRVDVQSKPQGDGTSDVIVAINEKPRWSVGVGARWSSERGEELLFDLRDRNLFRRAVAASLRGSWGSDDKRAQLIISSPLLPHNPFTYGLTLQYSDEILGTSPFGDETRERTSATVDATWHLDRGVQLRTYLSGRRTTTVTPDFFITFESTTDVASIGFQTIIERLDDPFDPRSGWAFTSDIRYSPPELGSDLHTVESQLSGFVALEPLAGWTWAQRLRLGLAEAVEGVLDPDVKLRAGGEASVRGFDTETIGIEDPATGIIRGGGALLILNEELRIPVRSWLRIAVFADIGKVWPSWSEVDGELAVGTGIGLRLDTPIGPVWADVAWPVADQGPNSGPSYSFGIGRPF